MEGRKANGKQWVYLMIKDHVRVLQLLPLGATKFPDLKDNAKSRAA